MKKRHKLLVAAAALVAAVFIGCSMVDSDSVSSTPINVGPSISQTGGETLRTMSAIVENMDEFDVSTSAGNGTVRTIMPDIDATTYDYILYGKALVGSETIGPKVVSITDKKFKEEMASVAWDFTLLAIDSTNTTVFTASGSHTLKGDPTLDGLRGHAALAAYAFVDLTRESGDATFRLTPDGLTGDGIINFKIILSDTNSESALWALPTTATVHAGIQNLITGEYITGFEEAELSTGDAGKYAYGSGSTKLKPGTYNLVVVFKNTVGGKTTESYWSDVLVVVPNRSVTENVYVPNIIGTLPANVTSLRATYVTGSEDLPGREEFYKVHFAWDAAAVTNEKYFKLEVADVSNLTDDTFRTADTWAAGVTSKTYAPTDKYGDPGEFVDFTSCDERFDGSLVRNNGYVTMYLPLGKAYTARIKAVNNFGESAAWTYVTIPTEVAPTDLEKDYNAVNPLSFFADATSTASTVIHRGRITYNLNGGVYGVKSANEVKYHTLLTLVTASRNKKALWAANVDTLKRGNDSFVAWTSDGNTNNRVYIAVTKDTADAADVGDAACVKATGGFVQTTKTGIAAMKAVVVAASPTVTAVETADDGGYSGVENVTLYADYSGVLKGLVDTLDMSYDYRLSTAWILYDSASPAGGTPVTADTKVVDTALIPWSKATNGTSIGFAVKLPADGEYTIGGTDYVLRPENSKANVTLTLKDTRGNIKGVKSIALNGFGTGFAIGNTDALFDIENWENGNYTAYIDSQIKTTGKTITRSVRVTVEITD